jgi:hypothetical protein
VVEGSCDEPFLRDIVAGLIDEFVGGYGVFLEKKIAVIRCELWLV